MCKFIKDGNIKSKILKRLLVNFWDNSINPITGHRAVRGFDRTHTHTGDGVHVREGIDQRLYSHDRLHLNPSVFNLHLDFFNQKTMSSGECDKFIEKSIKKIDIWERNRNICTTKILGSKKLSQLFYK